jgi:hypothetical protein
MKDLQKKLTQEQKEIVYEFVASWIKSGRKIDDCMFDNMKSITDGEVNYTINMNSFDTNKLFGIIVNNFELKLRIVIRADEIINKSLVDYICNYMISILSMDKGKLSDKEFNEITNLEVDLSMSRSKKVKRLIEKMI